MIPLSEGNAGRWVASALLALLAFDGCTCGPPPPVPPDDAGTFDAGSDDITPPRIVATTPGGGSTNAPADGPLTIEFSEPMDVASLTLSIAPAAALGPPSWSFENSVVTVVPTVPLSYSTHYQVIVTCLDLASHALTGDPAFDFTTEPPPDPSPPRITSTTPADAATSVSIAAPVSVTFSKPMDVGTVTVAIAPYVDLGPPTWSDADRTVSFSSPAQPFATSTPYTVTVDGKDPAGNALTAPTAFGFRTGATADVTRPTVVNTAPAEGATGVSAAAALSVTFSEPMTRATAEAAFSSSPAVSCAFTWDAPGTRLTCKPSVALTGGASYAVTVGAGAQDLAGNSLALPFTFSFATAPVADTTAPTIVSITPANLTAGVDRSPDILVVFSEPMDQTAAQTAFSIASPLGFNTGTFSWDAAGSTMTYRVAAPFVNGQTVLFTVGTGAKDLAGNPLASAASRTFRVVQAATANLAAKIDGYVTNLGVVTVTGTSMLAGDTTTGTYRSFVSFDLATLPATTLRIQSATLYLYQSGVSGSPYSLGALMASSVSFGSALTAAAYSAPVLETVQCSGLPPACAPAPETRVLSTTTQAALKSAIVTAKVNDDFTNRAARGGLCQFRIAFPLDRNTNFISDRAILVTSESLTTANRPRLAVTYEFP